MSSFHKYFSFGQLKTQLDQKFVWYDSFTRQKVEGGALLAQLSSQYDYAVAIMRTACFRDLSGDGIKIASKHFMQAAWLFENLISRSSQIPANETSTDFCKETLTMCSNLCLAQAQYLFFKKASDAGMAPKILARVSAQVSIYFDKASEACNINSQLKSF